MGTKIRRPLAGGEGGFTLIELLVVMMILGVLAGIGIPTFLGQRDKAYRATVQHDLSSLAKSQAMFEDVRVETGTYQYLGKYGSVPELKSTGYRVSDGVKSYTYTSSGNGSDGTRIDRYCAQAYHASDSQYQLYRVYDGDPIVREVEGEVGSCDDIAATGYFNFGETEGDQYGSDPGGVLEDECDPDTTDCDYAGEPAPEETSGYDEFGNYDGVGPWGPNGDPNNPDNPNYVDPNAP